MFIENPEKKPLNELIISIKEDGVQKKISALNIHWVKTRIHVKYIPLPMKLDQTTNGAAIDEWISETKWFNKELEWMLELECYEFWSYILYDPGCIECIISFLQESTPSYIPINTITENDEIINLYSDVMRNILTIICRLITNRENDIQWIDKKYLAEILYTKYIISIPMLFDLITTYGRSNIQILKKIFDTIFKIEPKYKNDLKFGLQFIQKAMNIIQRKSETEKQLKILNDLTIHALDCAFTLNLLLEIFPDSRLICSDLKFEHKIVEFYENVIPYLYKKIYNIDLNSPSLRYINHARIEFLAGFRGIIYLHIENILKFPNKSLVPAELYLNTLTESISEHIFVGDYNKLYPIENDMEIIKQACPKIDNFKIEFIMQALSNENGFNDENCSDEIEEFENYENILIEGGAAAPSSSGVADHNSTRSIEQEVQSIRDVFSDLGDGFIRKLLLRYENAELAISAILEGNLPPDLSDADQNEVYIPPDPQDSVFLETGIRRINIYDGDDYDVMTQDKPKGIIKKGKGLPGEPKTIKDLLDDKTHVNALKTRYQEYSMVTEDIDDYDDEYDDSYDALAESETKKFVKLSAAKNIMVDEVEDEESQDEFDDEEQQHHGAQKSKLDFCENPEAIRARYEQKRQIKMGNNSNNFTKRNFDVEGKPKGQGQDEKTVHNRQKKEVNKSSRANHNRKQGSTWKRNRGMIPS